MSDGPARTLLTSSKVSKREKKLPRLPPHAKVHKRPLLHPQIAPPYSGPQQPKIVYVSTNTPFIAAVKRAEKLLHLADKRAVQSATALVSQNRSKRKRKDGDELLEIAEAAEAEKKRRKLETPGAGAREEVVFKGTGKAIHKVLELALWFQQRDEYAVHLKTGTVGAVDSITIEGNAVDEADESKTDHSEGAGDAVMLDADKSIAEGLGTHGKRSAKSNTRTGATILNEEIPETRIRYTSVLEVAVSLR